MTDPINGEDLSDADLDPGPSIKVAFQFGVIGFNAEGPSAYLMVFMERYLEWIEQRLTSTSNTVANAVVNAMVQAQGSTKQ